MKEKPQFKVLICRRNNFLIICLVLVWVRFLLHSRYMSGKPFVGREDQWMHFRLIRFIKSTKFKRDSAKRDFMSNLTVYLDEVTEYSWPSHLVGVFQKGITRWELSIEAALPEDLTEKETVKRFLHELWKYLTS